MSKSWQSKRGNKKEERKRGGQKQTKQIKREEGGGRHNGVLDGEITNFSFLFCELCSALCYFNRFYFSFLLTFWAPIGKLLLQLLFFYSILQKNKKKDKKEKKKRKLKEVKRKKERKKETM